MSEEGKILKRLEERYGYLPKGEEVKEKELIDELLEWLKKRRQEKFKKVI